MFTLVYVEFLFQLYYFISEECNDKIQHKKDECVYFSLLLNPLDVIFVLSSWRRFSFVRILIEVESQPTSWNSNWDRTRWLTFEANTKQMKFNIHVLIQPWPLTKRGQDGNKLVKTVNTNVFCFCNFINNQRCRLRGLKVLK